MKKWLKFFTGVFAFVLFVTNVSFVSVFAQDNVLKVQLDVEVASLDPSIATDGHSMDVINTLYEGLMTRDEAGNVLPGMAESYEVNQDETVYTFKIRDNANWSNGEPVTAQDFVFSWHRLSLPETASEYSFMLETAGIKNASQVLAGEMKAEELGIKALDDKTLEVTLERATPYFLSLLTFTTFHPINQAFYEEIGDQFATAPDKLLSNGPFLLTNYAPAATTIDVQKNPDYYAAGDIKLDGIQFQVIKDSQQAVLAYQTGQLDVAKLTGEQVALYTADPELNTISQGYLWYLSPNEDNEALANKEFRLALSKAFDRDSLTGNVLKDGSASATYFIPRGLLSNEDGVDYRDVAGEGLMASNVEEAQAHYEKAKEELGADKFEIGLLVEDTEASINIAQSLEAQIEANLPGIDLQIEQTPKKNRLQRMVEGDYDLGLTRWGPDYADPTTYFQLLLSDSNYNYQKYSNSEFDQAYDDIMIGDLVTDVDKRWEKMIEMEKWLMDDAAIFPVYQATSALLIKSNVEGIRFYTVGGPHIYNYVVKQ